MKQNDNLLVENYSVKVNVVKINDERKKQLDEKWEVLPKPYRMGAERYFEKYALINGLRELADEYKEVARERRAIEARDQNNWTPSEYGKAYELSHKALAIKRRANALGYDIEEETNFE